MAALCKLLQIAPSGYYKWCRAQPSRRALEDARLAAEITQVHLASRRNYGAPRIVQELRVRGLRISRRRCHRLMRHRGLRGRKRHRRRPQTTNSRHGGLIARNRLLGRAPASGPNQIWLTDITYLATVEGWLYLAVVLDAWSRRVVGWACSATLHTAVALEALQNALTVRRPAAGLIHHSDRGCQYVDRSYLEVLASGGVERSMSRAGNCYDNATIESFWSTLKTETGLDQSPAASRRQAELTVLDYIETFYNPTRRHSSLGYLSPVAFETIKN